MARKPKPKPRPKPKAQPKPRPKPKPKLKPKRNAPAPKPKNPPGFFEGIRWVRTRHGNYAIRWKYDLLFFSREPDNLGWTAASWGFRDDLLAAEEIENGQAVENTCPPDR